MMMALCVHAASWINYLIVSLNLAFIIWIYSRMTPHGFSPPLLPFCPLIWLWWDFFESSYCWCCFSFFSDEFLANGTAYRIPPSLLPWCISLWIPFDNNLASFQDSLHCNVIILTVSYYKICAFMHAGNRIPVSYVAFITIITVAMSTAIYLISLNCNRSLDKLLHFALFWSSMHIKSTIRTNWVRCPIY